MHGSGDAGHGALVGFPGQGRRQLGLAHLHRPLDHGPEDRLLVDLLARIPEHVLHHRRAGDDQHRALGVVGVGHSGQQVGGAGAVGGDADAGPSGDAAVAVRHQGGGLLVAGGEKLDVVPAVHAVENLEHARSHDADHLANAELRQHLGDSMSRGHLHNGFPPGCWEREALCTMLFRTVKERGGQHKRWPCKLSPLASWIPAFAGMTGGGREMTGGGWA